MENGYVDLLGLENWKIENVIEKDKMLLITARFTDETQKCRHCQTGQQNIKKFGVKKKLVRDTPVRGKPVRILLIVQKYRCQNCLRVFTVKVGEIAEYMRITNRLSKYIENQLFQKTFSQINQETGVGIGTIKEILLKLVTILQKSFAATSLRVIGIDEVYIGRVARGIITDIENKRFIELLPRRRCDFIERFLMEVNNKEDIKYVTIDMHRPYKIAVNRKLPGAKVVIDKFHVQRMGNQAINKYLAHLRASFSLTEKKKYVKDRFLLYKRSYDLSDEARKKLEEWCEIFPQIRSIYNLKEDFLQIWQAKTKSKAKNKFENWKNKIPSSLLFVFKDILRAFKNWFEEIFNYFECFLTNAFTESLNSIIKAIVRKSNGCSFDVIRAKLICRDMRSRPVIKKN